MFSPDIPSFSMLPARMPVTAPPSEHPRGCSCDRERRTDHRPVQDLQRESAGFAASGQNVQATLRCREQCSNAARVSTNTGMPPRDSSRFSIPRGWPRPSSVRPMGAEPRDARRRRRRRQIRRLSISPQPHPPLPRLPRPRVLAGTPPRTSPCRPGRSPSAGWHVACNGSRDERSMNESTQRRAGDREAGHGRGVPPPDPRSRAARVTSRRAGRSGTRASSGRSPRSTAGPRRGSPAASTPVSRRATSRRLRGAAP